MSTWSDSQHHSVPSRKGTLFLNGGQTSVGKGIEKPKSSHIASGNVKWNSSWKNTTGFWKSQTRITYDPAILLLSTCTRKNWKHGRKKILVHQCLLHLFNIYLRQYVGILIKDGGGGKEYRDDIQSSAFCTCLLFHQQSVSACYIMNCVSPKFLCWNPNP